MQALFEMVVERVSTPHLRSLVSTAAAPLDSGKLSQVRPLTPCRPPLDSLIPTAAAPLNSFKLSQTLRTASRPPPEPLPNAS
eukprot:529991-Prorocentrum_minimum.AAC.1